MLRRMTIFLGITLSLLMPMSATETQLLKDQARTKGYVPPQEVSENDRQAEIADIETRINRWQEEIEQNNTLPPGFQQQANAPLQGEIRRLQALVERLKKQ